MKPNFFIVGGTKSATTNISYYLDQHEKVYVSKLNEPYYYCRFDVPLNFKRDSMIKNEKDYLKLFEKAQNQIAIGEASSVYLHCPTAPKAINEDNNSSKIIIVIRNPIDKCFSSYFSYKFMNLDKRSFDEKINFYEKQIENNEFDIYNFLEQGFFSKHIKNYFQTIQKNRIKILFFEDYIKDEKKYINQLWNFLGIHEPIELKLVSKNSYRIPKNIIAKKLLSNRNFRNISTKLIPTIKRQQIGEKFFVKQTKIPKMMPEQRLRLKEFFKNEYEELSKLLNQNPPWIDFD